MSKNGNAYNGTNRLQRFEFEFKGRSYPFTINPERYDMEIPNRVNVTYTKAGAFAELFGEGLKEISLEGTTGMTAGTQDKNHGYQKMVELRNLLRENFQNIEDGSPVKDFLTFYNHTDGDAWITIPSKLRIMRNKDQPLHYKYDIHLYVIRALGEPEAQSTTQMVGSPVDTPTTYTKTVEDREKEKGADEKSPSKTFSKEHHDKKEEKKTRRKDSKD